MNGLEKFHWEIFIGLEILSLLFLLIFFIFRYFFDEEKHSRIFIGLFIFCIVLEGCLAFLLYRKTGEISIFQIIIMIFILYACTFGVTDMKKLDLFMKRHIGKWRDVELLTEEDVKRMKRYKDPTYQARQYRLWWYGHDRVFIIAHSIFWLYDGRHEIGLFYYITDWSWWKHIDESQGPFHHEMITQVSKLW